MSPSCIVALPPGVVEVLEGAVAGPERVDQAVHRAPALGRSRERVVDRRRVGQVDRQAHRVGAPAARSSSTVSSIAADPRARTATAPRRRRTPRRSPVPSPCSRRSRRQRCPSDRDPRCTPLLDERSWMNECRARGPTWSSGSRSRRDPPHDQVDDAVDPVGADLVDRSDDRRDERRTGDQLEHGRRLRRRAAPRPPRSRRRDGVAASPRFRRRSGRARRRAMPGRWSSRPAAPAGPPASPAAEQLDTDADQRRGCRCAGRRRRGRTSGSRRGTRPRGRGAPSSASAGRSPACWCRPARRWRRSSAAGSRPPRAAPSVACSTAPSIRGSRGRPAAAVGTGAGVSEVVDIVTCRNVTE